MDVVSFRENRLGDKPRQQDFGFQPQLKLATAIARSQNYLLGVQKPEGYWVGELMVDATLVADTIASMTDQQALRLYQRLTGLSQGSVLDPIVS